MKQQQVFIISGEQGKGKTTVLMQVINELIEKGIGLDGFVAVGEWNNNLRTGFSIKHLKSGESQLLCFDHPDEKFEQIGRFYFNPQTIKLGEKILSPAKDSGIRVKVIDEIGLFELQGKVWANIFTELLNSDTYPLLITVREKFVKQVITKFQIENYLVFDLRQTASKIALQINRSLKKEGSSLK